MKVLVAGPDKIERVEAFKRKTLALLKKQAGASFTFRSIEEYQTSGSLHKLLIAVGRILNNPKKLELLRDIRSFIMRQHLPTFDEEVNALRSDLQSPYYSTTFYIITQQ